MSPSEDRKYLVVLLQHPAPPNVLGEMTETELYGYLGTKLGEVAAKAVLSELENTGTAAAEFEAPFGLKTLIEIRLLEPQ